MATKITAEITATGTDHIGPYATITTSQGYDMTWNIDTRGDYVQACAMCRGTGHRPEYAGIRGGICFYCVGGVYKNRRGNLDYAIAETIQEGKRWKARRAAAKRRADGRAVDLAERLAARDAAVAEFKTAHPQLIASMTRLAATDSTVQNMVADMDSSGDLPNVGVAESLIARLAHAEAIAEDHAREGFEYTHIGQVGDKVDLTVRVTHAMVVDGFSYGSTQVMVVAEVTDGPHARQIVKLYSTAAWAYDVERGDTVTVTGATVKRHGAYDGAAQTQIGGRMRATVTKASDGE